MRHQPPIRLGAFPEGEGIRFHLWAPTARQVDVVREHGPALALHRREDGYFTGWFRELRIGDRYRYRIDGAGPFPDPASRFQPEGVHGPSEIIDARPFPWSDADWPGVKLEELVLYELHVGTFTPAGTFAAVTERLPDLVELGVTAIELMPIADFPGRRNWGYDGVCLFAPARCYGRPDDLRRLVNEAHRLGLAVFLDVVYNHLGPDGNYLRAFSPYYFTDRHQTPWGDALNFDGDSSAPVRAFFLANALYWLSEYHFDGLRLDATHAILDDSPRPFLAELTEEVRQALPERSIVLIAEDHRNLAQMIRSHQQGGWGLDGVWADDFHHQLRRLLAGDHEGYYHDFTGSVDDLVTTIRQGWFYCGQYSDYLQETRGTDPTGLNPRSFVVCLQNHDQVGNRALGERLHHQIDLAAYRAASALLLCVPQTPLLFMGQEWACSAPFLYFTDHHEELGRLVTQGRRQEFRHFSSFSDPQAQQKIPDPQAEQTFQVSILPWSEVDQEPHASIRRLYRALLHLRRTEPALQSAKREEYQVEAFAETILLRRQSPSGPTLLLVVRLRGSGVVDLQAHPLARPGSGHGWEMVLNTDDPAYGSSGNSLAIQLHQQGPILHFQQPAAVIFRETILKSSSRKDGP